MDVDGPKSKMSWATQGPGTNCPSILHHQFDLLIVHYCCSLGSVPRNLPPILAALSPIFGLESTRNVLEIASGFGAHLRAYAENYPAITFQPTECDDYLCREIVDETNGLSNVVQPRVLDVLDEGNWQQLRAATQLVFDVVVILNLLHVAPWRAISSLALDGCD
jgi:hypothetical protein